MAGVEGLEEWKVRAEGRDETPGSSERGHGCGSPEGRRRHAGKNILRSGTGLGIAGTKLVPR